MTKISLDTNVLIYNHGIDGNAKQLIAGSLLDRVPVISTQVISEYLNVMKRISKMIKSDLLGMCAEWLEDCQVHSVNSKSICIVVKGMVKPVILNLRCTSGMFRDSTLRKFSICYRCLHPASMAPATFSRARSLSFRSCRARTACAVLSDLNTVCREFNFYLQSPDNICFMVLTTSPIISCLNSYLILFIIDCSKCNIAPSGVAVGVKSWNA